MTSDPGFVAPAQPRNAKPRNAKPRAEGGGAARGRVWERVARAFGESLGYGARFMAAAACPGLEGRRVASTAMRSKTKRARSCSINASVTLATLQSGVADLVLAYRDAPSSQTNRPPSRPGGRSAFRGLRLTPGLQGDQEARNGAENSVQVLERFSAGIHGPPWGSPNASAAALRIM
jgi:hypothetical protein